MIISDRPGHEPARPTRDDASIKPSALPFPSELRFTFEVVDRILRGVSNVKHAFMDTKKFLELQRSSVAMGTEVYWYELLARAHMGAHMSLLRMRSWLRGADVAWGAGNLFLYAASVRGLLESTADTFFTFRLVPMTLATHQYHIARALGGKSKMPHIIGDLEDALIHFTHGRRLERGQKATAPKPHDAMTIQTYLRSFGSEYEKVAALYERLCAFTHPSAESLMPFVVDYEEDTWQLTQPDQSELIRGFHNAYYEVISGILIKALIGPAVTLKLLNSFKDDRLYTPALDDVDLREIPIWKKIEQAIERSARTPLRELARKSSAPEVHKDEDSSG